MFFSLSPKLFLQEQINHRHLLIKLKLMFHFHNYVQIQNLQVI